MTRLTSERLLGLLVTIITTTTTTTSQSHPDSHIDILGRLDNLERLMSQQQFQQEREQWRSDNAALKDRMTALEKDVVLLKAQNLQLKNSAQLTRQAHAALTVDNRRLKADVAILRQGLASMTTTQQSLVARVTRFVDNGIFPHGHDDNNSDSGDKPLAETSPLSGVTPLSGATPLSGVTPLSDSAKEHADPASEDGLHLLDVSLRSDDTLPLEAVVSQMTQQLTQVTADVQTLRNVNTQQDQAIQEARGSSYIRWGHSTCPVSTELVYSGVMGGSLHTLSGAGANALCLSLSPVLLNPRPDQPHTLLYGGEYETYDSHMNKDPDCAVCRSLRPTTIMVPGTNVCSSGWTLEYSGYLMAGHHTHAASTQFICVDTALEGRIGSDDDHNGHLLYYTETECGSLPCPPYEAYKLVTCAVCSK